MSRFDVHGLLRACAGIAVSGVLSAVPALAADDAGTQSPFGTGAGNRALSMGAAFVATADDASALFWNPAGLGRVQRSEFQAMQSGDLGEGFTEAFASASIPSWRWGTLGLSIRHFGVDGIDRRDDRNALLGTDVSDSQLEVAVGYGRSFGEAWSGGAAVKLQRQSLAGFSGSGLGLDLGLQLRPGALFAWQSAAAQGLSIGLAVRNAVEPAIRLDRESVSDPMALRGGLAWQTLLGAADGLLVETDLESVRGAGLRVRAGAEYRFRSLAALRVGMNGSRLTAGSGVAWNGMSLDYAFEDSPLSPAHRLGLSVPFGATVRESRIAAEQAEDARLQERLAEAFRERQRQQIASLVADAEQRAHGGDFQGALEAIAVVLTLEPDHARARQLEIASLNARAAQLERNGELAAAALTFDRVLALAPDDAEAQAGAARTRAESARRAARTSEIQKLFAGAMDAFAAEDLRAARDGFAAVLTRKPGDAEASRMLERTNAAVAQRVARLSEQAERFASNGLLSEARALLEQAEALDSRSSGVARARLALARAQRAATADARASAEDRRPEAPKPKPAAPSMSDRQLQDLYDRGIEALRQGRSGDAIRFLEIVWSARPDYRQAADHLKREHLTRGMESYASGRLEEAVTSWSRVLAIDPSDTRARGYLARAQKQLARRQEILDAGR